MSELTKIQTSRLKTEEVMLNSGNQDISGNKNFTGNLTQNGKDVITSAGGVVSGTILLKDTQTAVKPTADTWHGASIPFYDKNSTRVSYIQPRFRANGTVELYIAASDPTNGAKALVLSSDGTLKFAGNTFATIKESYKNGSEWYRVWSDGFIEQGGVTAPTLSGNSLNKTITFTKSFTQEPMVYAHVVSPQGVGYDIIRSSSTTNFVYYGQSAAGNYQANVTKLNWYACGY